MNTDWTGFGRAVIWVIYAVAIVAALLFFIKGLADFGNIGATLGDTDPIDAGYDTFIATEIGVHFGASVCCLLFAIAVRPRSK